jgi:hypothetical protein
MSHAGDRDELGVPARVLRKILVSLLVGGFAYGITELTNQEQIWSLTISVFVGGLVMMVQFLVTFENRLAKAEDVIQTATARTEEMVRDGFAKMNEATELFSLVEDSALRTDVVTGLVRRSTQINPAAPELVLRFAQAEISRTSRLLKDLGEADQVTYEGEDRDWLLSLAGNAALSIDATSFTAVDASRDGFWDSYFGQRYLAVQRAAVERGVRVRRVFVIARLDEDTTDDLLSICHPQQEKGIDVRVLEVARIPGARWEALFDFVVFDRAISYEVKLSTPLEPSSVHTILSTHLELEPKAVRSRVERFDQLWGLARGVSPAGIGP